MKKTNLRILSFILALVILTLSLPTFPMVADAAEEEAEALEVGEEILTYTEEVELRDTFTKHFRRSDGKYVAVVYAEPVHAGESGNMTDIDNRLTYRASSGRYESANEEFAVSFAPTPDADRTVSVTFDGYTLSWRVDAVRNPRSSGWVTMSTSAMTPITVQPERASSLATASVTDTGFVDASSLSVFTKEQISSAFTSISGIRYQNAFTGGNGVDLSYTLAPNRLEEDIILKSKNDIRSYVLTMSAEGLTAEKQADNSILFVDADGKEVFTVGAPWMQDAEYAFSDSFTVSLVQKGDTVTVIYTPDAAWLNDAARVYPVLIDPSVKSRNYTSNYEDGYIGSTSTSSTTSSVKNYVGTSSGYVTYTKILSHPYIYESMTIDSATMTFVGSREASTNHLSVITSSFDFDSLTEENPPATIGNISPDITGVGSYYKHTYDITSIALDYVTDYGYSGLDQIAGYRLYNSVPTVTLYTQYFSSEGAAAYRPVLEITYSKSYDLPFVGGGIYTIINKNSNKAVTCAPGYTNVYQIADLGADRQAFKLVGDKRIFTIEPVAISGSALTWDYSGSSTAQTSTNLYSATKFTANADKQEFIFQYVSEDANGYEYYAILSRADTRYALTAYGTSNGSTSGTSVTSSGNIYMSTYTGSASQLWRLESGGMPVYNGKNIVTTSGRTFSYDYGVVASEIQPYCYITTYGEQISWVSGSESVFTFDGNGKVTIVGAGSATLRARILDSSGNLLREYMYTVKITIDNGVYYIKNTKTGTYLSVPNMDPASGDDVSMQSKETSGEGMYRQLWKVHHLGNGRYSIRSMVRLNNALDVTGNVVDVWSIGLTDTRAGVPDYAEWDFVLNNEDTYRIRHNGLNTETLYATESGIGINTVATTSSAVQSAGQEWKLEKVTIPERSLILLNAPTHLAPKETVDVNATYYTTALASQQVTWTSSDTSVATVDGNGVVTGVSMGVATITATSQVNTSDTASFTVTVTNVAEGQYFLRSPQSGEILTESGTGYQIDDFTNGDDQLFVLDRVDGEYYSIKSVESGKYLTVSGNSTANNADVIQSTLASTGFTSGQLWKFEPTADGRYKIYTKAVNESGSTTKYVLTSGSSNGVKQSSWDDNATYYDEWKLYTPYISIVNYYDSSLYLPWYSYIDEAVAYANKVYSTLFDIEIQMDGEATLFEDAIADQCSRGNNLACNESTCGHPVDFHKNIINVSDQLYGGTETYTHKRDNSSIYVMWNDRDSSVYNVAYYLTEEQDEFINQTTLGAIACVYDSRPVVHIMSITSIIQSDIIDFSDDDVIALMSINLVHEMAHCFGMGEAYTIAGHDITDGTACAMEYYDTNDAVRFYNDTVTTGRAFCDDCVNTLQSLVSPFIDGN